MIDADALIQQMEADAEQMEEPIAKMFTYAAINDVKHQPTIEERKTGRWQKVSADKYRTSASYVYRCDKCGDNSWYDSNFCPNCGARMEGNT